MNPSKSTRRLLKIGRLRSSFNEYRSEKRTNCKRCGEFLNVDNPTNEELFCKKKGLCVTCYLVGIKPTKPDNIKKSENFHNLIYVGMEQEEIWKLALKLGYSQKDIDSKKYLLDPRLGYKCTCLPTRECASR